MKKLIIIWVFLCGTLNIFAQDEREVLPPNFVLKYGLFQPFTAGEVPITFEHAFNSKISYEVTAGLTYSKVVLGAADPNFNGGYVVSPNEHKLGFVLQAALRFYPLNRQQAPKGFFISPEIKFRQYRSEYRIWDHVDYSYSHVIRPFNQLIFRFNVGYQFLIGNAVAMDLFGGIGLNNRWGRLPHEGSVQDPVTGEFTLNSYDANMNKIIPHATIGFRIGFAGRVN